MPSLAPVCISLTWKFMMSQAHSTSCTLTLSMFVTKTPLCPPSMSINRGFLVVPSSYTGPVVRMVDIAAGRECGLPGKDGFIQQPVCGRSARGCSYQYIVHITNTPTFTVLWSRSGLCELALDPGNLAMSRFPHQLCRSKQHLAPTWLQLRGHRETSN